MPSSPPAAAPAAQISSTSPESSAPSPSRIRLDLHATAEGRAVQDLTVADLDVNEAGTPQKIETLRHFTASARSFVVFLATAHMRFEGALHARVPLVRFLDGFVGFDVALGGTP